MINAQAHQILGAYRRLRSRGVGIFGDRSDTERDQEIAEPNHLFDLITFLVSTTMSTSNELFPTIGDVAGKTSANDENKAVETVEEEEKVVDEIDSLCMKCFEQVSTTRHTKFGSI